MKISGQSFGEYLKSERERKNIRLEEIASITKIHLHSLDLLEKNNFSKLPPEPFIRGFILAYAKYVGLDPKDTLHRYYVEVGKIIESIPEVEPKIPVESETASLEEIELEVGEEISEPVLNKENLVSPDTSSPTVVPYGKLVAGFATLFIFLGVSSLIWLGKKKGPTAITNAESGTSMSAEAPPATSLMTVPQIAVGQNSSHATTTEMPTMPHLPSTAAHTIYIEGNARSWMKVVADEESPVETFLEQNEKKTLTAKNKIKVVLGNSSGIKVFHNNEINEGKKIDGTIRQYVFPADARFPQDRVKRALTKEEETEAPNGVSEEPTP